MEEDLFADLQVQELYLGMHLLTADSSYDGDENAGDSKPQPMAPVENSEPMPAPTAIKAEPGYGEEPDTAPPPESFEDFAPGSNDVKEEYSQYNDDMDRSYSTAPAAVKDEPLQMKEDG